MALAVYTIPAGYSFVDALARGLIDEAAGAPERLARDLVLLPTRRACRTLAEAFLRAAGGRALLLPRLAPIGDVDEDELSFAGFGGAGAAAAAALPPALPALRRQLLLARLVKARHDSVPGAPTLAPDQAAWLAADLAALLDRVQTERRDLADLKALVPDAFAAHWGETLRFLSILTAEWPAILAAEGALDPADRRNRLLEAEAAAWRAAPPPFRVIAAGSTGSVPATADLLATVAALPGGAVILPGLDRALDDAAWTELPEAPSHPQHGLARLLLRLGIDRAAVADWPHLPKAPPRPARAAVLSAALRPPEHAAPPPESLPEPAAVAADLGRDFLLLEAATPREEAAAIALALRQALDVPERTAALVTADRDLARRVAAALARWNVVIDDSAGVPLTATAPGAYLALLADAVAAEGGAVPVLALLKHPLAAGGRSPGAFRALVRRVERRWREERRPPGRLDDLALTGDEAAWRDDLARRLAPFADLFRAGIETPLDVLLSAHVAAAEALAETDAAPGANQLWRGEAGGALNGFVAELAEAAPAFGALTPSAYPALFAALAGGVAVRPRQGAHPRLAILGPLEARLHHADVTVLGGLNDGAWPPAIDADPWMSRPMRRAFGLPLDERRIGLAAHDFVQAAMAPRVIATRARRQGGQPTAPSRWLLRIGAVLGTLGLAGADGRTGGWTGEGDLLAWARALDDAPHAPVARPEPRPPREARPEKLSVTEIETWQKDPYQIYARHVLGLATLAALDAEPGVAELGIAVHEAVAQFLAELRDAAPPAGAEARLLAYLERAVGGVLGPALWPLWQPRARRIAAWFVAAERQRRAAGFVPVAIERRGEARFLSGEAALTLSGKADRIDRDARGRLAIVDYKTGTVPNGADVAAGWSPQLPLLAAIALRGGIAEVRGDAIAELAYWRLTGGRVAGEVKDIDAVEGAVTTAIGNLERLIAAFANPAQPYASVPRPSRRPKHSDYDHLARVDEWLGVEQVRR
jgi:ATP-dependent helicase/nuclease subunit B